VDDLSSRRPEDFPETASTISPENFVGLDWDAVVEINPEWTKWRPASQSHINKNYFFGRT
jgi:hypothetical protein